MALELRDDQLVFNFPQVHKDAKLIIEFQRTLRIPDDGNTYPLPPGLGRFPMKHTEDHAARLPAHWKEHGGVFVPLYQSEALWINFHPQYSSLHRHAYPFIVKVGTGKKSALTGKEWRKGIHKGDYCVIPEQPWLDGYVVEEGVIAQFVAVPLGMGLTVEEQLGGEGIGGIQLEVFPMKAEQFELRWPKQELTIRPMKVRRRAGGQQGSAGGFGPFTGYPPGVYTTLSNSAAPGAAAGAAAEASYSCDVLRCCDFEEQPEVAEMGIGAGGRMKQQVFEDPYGKDAWSRKVDSTRRCFVHLANSMAWESITGEKPPETPATAAAYERHGLPWFDYYSDTLQAKKGAKLFQGVKTVKNAAKDKGIKGILPENESVKPKTILAVKEVRNGNW